MAKKPKILLTNDDGIHAPGLKSLWEALHNQADLYIIAPASERSGAGLSITLTDPLQIQTVAWEKSTPAWKVTGTPVDCIRMGLSTILDSVPDLIVSGVNRGANSGRTVLYSGTIGGVIEGIFRNIPGVAFSCHDFENPNYARTQPWIQKVVSHLLEHPLPKGTLLNVNFPETPEILGLKFAKQGRGYWIEDPEHRLHPEGHSYYWLGGKWNDQEEHEESDVALVQKGYAAAVPILIDQLTHHALFEERKSHFDAHFGSH